MSDRTFVADPRRKPKALPYPKTHSNLQREHVAAARLAASWLSWYPDADVFQRLDALRDVACDLPEPLATPLGHFLDWLTTVDQNDAQRHYVEVFDMKRRASLYLSYWTDGDTRNRGVSILRFKSLFRQFGFTIDDRELADHLAIVCEFAATGDETAGDALLAEHAGALGLIREALASFESPYVHVLDLVLATLPAITPEIEQYMRDLARNGPPAEMVGLEPFAASSTATALEVRS